MGRRGYFAHGDPDGGPFWKRIEPYYPSASFRYWRVGENLVWSSPDISPSEALKAWGRSPKHRKIMLRLDWRDVGIAAIHVATAPGVYRRLPVTIITADFGVRR